MVSFFNLNSYGQLSILGQDGKPLDQDDIYGPYIYDPVQIALDYKNAFNVEISRDEAIMRGAYEQVKNLVDFNSGVRVILLTKESCGAGGLTMGLNIGTSEQPHYIKFAAVCTLSGSTGSLKENDTNYIDILHEVGHSFMGGGHAQYSSCNPSMTISQEDCTDALWEYGNPYDVMGSGWKYGQGTAMSLTKAGWLLDEPAALNRIVTVMPDTLPTDRTYKIKSISSQTPGIKALRIPRKFVGDPEWWNPNYLIIEWREPKGLDLHIAEKNLNNEADVFSGALITYTVAGESMLVHPILPASELTCTGPFQEQCPKVFHTALPFGQSYTDPNTLTKFTLGPKPTKGGELQIKIDSLGRTDFTGPQVSGLTVISNPADPCKATLRAEAIDPSGISKVIFYQDPLRGSDNYKIFAEDSTFPFEAEYDIRTMENQIMFQVFDNARQQGGIAENNFTWGPEFYASKDKAFSQCSLNIQTNSSIIIDSPSMDHPVSTANFKNYGNSYYSNQILTDRSPVKIIFTIHDENLLSTFNLTERGCQAYCPHCGGSGCVFFSTYLNSYPKEITDEITLNLTPGMHDLYFFVVDKSDGETNIFWGIKILPPLTFIRGDVNQDGRMDISDAIHILSYLFLGSKTIDCADSADVNDDGKVDISDAKYILSYMFLGTGSLNPPTSCGADPTPYDSLGCQSFKLCGE